jgi:hypothetical protein
MKERTLTHRDQKELDELIEQGLELLGGTPGMNDHFPEDPDDVVAIATAIRAYVDDFRVQGGNQNAEQIAFAIGALYGDVLARELEWTWVLLDVGQGPLFGIVPSDRSVAMRPQLFLFRLLSNQHSDNTTLLVFNMLRAGQMPKAAPKSYSELG